MPTIYVRGRREDVREALLELPRILTSSSDPLAKGFRNLIGFTLLAKAKDGFAIRSGPAGPKPGFGPEADGYAWEKLSPVTIANRRRGRRRLEKRLREKYREAKRERGARRKLLKKLYRQYVQAYIESGFSIPDARDLAKQRARREAMFRYRDLARTKREILGEREVMILRDTGVLFNSLSPGRISEDGTSYSPPSGPGGDRQLLLEAAGEVVIGTKVEYAGYHHSDQDRSGKLPQRRLWPKRIPWDWWEDVKAVAKRAIPQIVIEIVNRAGGQR